MKHIIAKAGKKELSYDGCFLTFKNENKSVSIRLIEEGCTVDTRGGELFIAEIARLMVVEMKRICQQREHIFPDELESVGVAWGAFKLCAGAHLAIHMLSSLKELGLLHHHRTAWSRQARYYTCTDEAKTFLRAIPKRRKRARLEVAFS